MEGTLGEVRMFAGTYAPRGWAFCAGQNIDIAQNDALYSLLGTTYGGDGYSTFGLPDLRGRVPVHTGTPATGGSAIVLGQLGGSEMVTLGYNAMPVHTHGTQASLAPGCYQGGGNSSNPKGNYPASSGSVDLYSQSATSGATMLPATGPVNIDPTGGSQPHENMPPYMGINYIICVEGMYPQQPY